jgi:ABC-type bacteriocin/lantibiotic exporter with double-glycine peptidase domain
MLLAQVILARPCFLLLDESIGHVDPRARKWFRERLRAALPDLAVVEISHGGAVLFPQATQIVVLEAGRVVQRGRSHDELVAQAGPYAEYAAATGH